MPRSLFLFEARSLKNSYSLENFSLLKNSETVPESVNSTGKVFFSIFLTVIVENFVCIGDCSLLFLNYAVKQIEFYNNA